MRRSARLRALARVFAAPDQARRIGGPVLLSRPAVSRAAGLLVAAGLGACAKPAPPPVRELTGSMTVDGAPAELRRCRPGHAVHVFVEIDTSLGTLRFGEGKLAWQGTALACSRLDRSWGGGVRQDGSAYFRGTLGFRCGAIAGDLALDCGQITADEARDLARNHAAARGSAAGR